MRDDQRRQIDLGDGVGHGKGLARSGNTEQHLVGPKRIDTVDDSVDSLRLIPGRGIRGLEHKFFHCGGVSNGARCDGLALKITLRIANGQALHLLALVDKKSRQNENDKKQ